MEITIKTITNKTSKTGTPFWVVDAVEGKYTVWDKEISDQLYTKMGQKCNVDVKVSGEFSNIRGILPDGQVDVTQAPAEPVQARQSVKGSAYEKDPVGLVIELICHGIGKDEAIKTIKEIQEAFK